MNSPSSSRAITPFERRHGVRVIINDASCDVRRTLVAHGVNSRVVHISRHETDAREHFRLHTAGECAAV